VLSDAPIHRVSKANVPLGCEAAAPRANEVSAP
jgi:hypothetical protein